MAGYQPLSRHEDSPDDDTSFAHQPIATGSLQQYQRQVIREQDVNLDVLAGVISRQRQMASEINSEIVDQNALIDDISDLAERGASKVAQQTRQVRAVDRRASTTCGYWVVIVLLFVAILLLFLL